MGDQEGTGLLIEKAKKIAPVIRKHAAEAERERHLSREVVDAMLELGLHSMTRPRSFGGLETDPVTMFRVVEEIARHDSAAAWNLQLSLGIYPLLAWLPDEGASEILNSHPAAVLGGSFSPTHSAIAVDGGYRVSGQWSFVSGAHHCRWLLFLLQVRDGDKLRVSEQGIPLQWFMVVPAESAKIVDTWNTLGMRGTGSHDVLITDQFIPERRTALVQPLETPGEAFQSALYRLTLWVSVALLAAPALGTARAAIDGLIELARAKTPNFTPSTLACRQVAQRQVAEAEATLGAGRAYLFETFEENWARATAGEPITTAHKIKMQLATSHAMACAARAIDLVHTTAGSSAIRNENMFQQHFRDVHTMTQHAFASASHYESAGALMFGAETDWGFFAL